MKNTYFAAREGKETATVLLAKANSWNNSLDASGYLEKLRMIWSAYHGAYYNDTGNGHEISFSGEQGELVNLPVNHLRNIGQHILNMICSNRPSMEARAANTDYKSLVQTQLANGILDYYMREKKLEVYLKTAVEYAVVMGSGYIKIEWNATAGEVYDFNEETQTEIKEGDIEFSNLSPFDVVIDGSKETQQHHDWVLTRCYKNKFDLAAKYPELAEKIIALPSKSDLYKNRNKLTTLQDETDDVEVYEFYHKRTDSMPNGRYMMFLAEEIVLQDLPMPYRVLPVFRISAGEILGTPYAYTPLMDIYPIQEAMNMLYSAGLTNLNATAVQNFWVPRGADIQLASLGGGLNIIEGNAKPEPLSLEATPENLFKMLEILERVAETLSGVNSVARGNPEASLKSGTALALVQSMALQFMSGLQQSYVNLIEDVGSAIIKILQDYAAAPRLVAIAGKNNRTEMKEFSSDNISNIARVYVDVGNPLARTTAGRVQMADNLLQYAQDKINPHQYIALINTGKLDVMTEDIQSELNLVRAENERMVDGEDIMASFVDDHKQHIMSHRTVLADPDLRKDPELVRRVQVHMQEHIELLRNTDPELLMMMGQQPLTPQGMPADGAPQQGGGQPPQSGPPMPEEQLPPPGMDVGVKIPQPASPPPPFENLPTDAAQMAPQG